MNYFVSAENVTYHHWQLELLIESFKLHNLEDSLLIAMAKSDEKIYVEYNKNLSAHKRVFLHDNLGRETECLQLNRIFGLYSALIKGLIKPPLVVLHPDMILIKPLPTEAADITFQLDQECNIENLHLNNDILQFIAEILKLKDLKNDFWINLGDTICLQNLSLDLIERILSLANYFAKQKIEIAEKLAWIIGFLEYFKYFRYYGTYKIENIMLDRDLKNIIHYKHGLPPFFNKKMFLFKPPTVLSMGDPLEILLQHNPTPVTNYFQKVVQSYKTKNKKTIGLNPQITIVNVSTDENK